MSENVNTLTLFPTTMNWLGTFDPLVQYLKNDVVIDTTDKATYVCLETSAALGVDPFLSPEWFLFTGTVAGVHTVDIIDGLSNVGSATQPIIQNDGAINLIAGSNIFLSGTAQNIIINSIAMSGFIDGLGIASYVSGEITNDGIRTIGTGGGLYLETPPPDAKISQNNILSVTTGAGITNINTAQNPVLENDWVRGLTLINIGNAGTAEDPLLTNAGVESVTNTDGTLQITGSHVQRTIACSAATETVLIANLSTMVPVGWRVVDANKAYINFTLASPLLQSAITNNVSYNVSIDLSAIIIRVQGGLIQYQSSNRILLYDATTNNYFSFHTQYISGLANLPIEISLGVLYFNSSYLVSNGLTTITGIAFVPNTDTSISRAWELKSYGSIYGTMTRGDLV